MVVQGSLGGLLCSVPNPIQATYISVRAENIMILPAHVSMIAELLSDSI